MQPPQPSRLICCRRRQPSGCVLSCRRARMVILIVRWIRAHAPALHAGALDAPCPQPAWQPKAPTALREEGVTCAEWRAPRCREALTPTPNARPIPIPSHRAGAVANAGCCLPLPPGGAPAQQVPLGFRVPGGGVAGARCHAGTWCEHLTAVGGQLCAASTSLQWLDSCVEGQWVGNNSVR